MSKCGDCVTPAWDDPTGCGTEGTADWQEVCPSSSCGEASITGGAATLTPLGDNNFEFSIDIGTGPGRTLVVAAYLQAAASADARLRAPDGTDIASSYSAEANDGVNDHSIHVYILSEADITGYSGSQTLDIRNYSGIGDGHIAGFVLLYNRDNLGSGAAYSNQASPDAQSATVTACDTVVMFGIAADDATGQTASYDVGTEAFSGTTWGGYVPYVGAYLDQPTEGSQTVTLSSTGTPVEVGQVIVVLSED